MTTSYSSSSSYRRTTTTSKETYNLRKGSMTTKLYGRDLSEYEDIDIDSLLTKLTLEELEELNNEVDPDNSLLPPSQRCRDQTDKKPTGPFNREELLKFLKDKAISEKDWDEKVRFEPGVKRGTVWKKEETAEQPTDQTKSIDFTFDTDGDVDIALSGATENDLVDLAGILGMHSMLTQNQYYNALEGKPQDRESTSFGAVAKASPLKIIPDEPNNDTDVLECTKRLRDNDSSLTVVNLNNMKTVNRDDLKELIQAACNSDHLHTLALANILLTDLEAANLVKLIETSKSLKNLNIESNLLSGECLISLLRASLNNQTLVELHAENQRYNVLGIKVEMELANVIELSESLLRVGVTFNSMEARYRVSDALEKNYERCRLRRLYGDSYDSSSQ